MRCDLSIFPGAILYVFLHLFMPLPQDLKKQLRVLVTIYHTVFSIQKVHFCETLLGEPEKSKKKSEAKHCFTSSKKCLRTFSIVLLYYTSADRLSITSLKNSYTPVIFPFPLKYSP